MSISPEPLSVRFDDDSFWVDPEDGRTFGLNLAWFPRLLAATPEQRADHSLGRAGIQWDAIDENISIAGLLAGRGDMTKANRAVA